MLPGNDTFPPGHKAFIAKLNALIGANLAKTDLNVDVLARLMYMSRPTFYRKVKCVSDFTPNELINTARLTKAASLLAWGDHKISEVASMVGFHSQSNFGKAFIKQFKVTPTRYQRLRKTDFRMPDYGLLEMASVIKSIGRA